MKRLLWLFPLLAACTGSQEPALSALLAAGGGGEVRFYPGEALRKGQVNPVATWPSPGLQDLAYAEAPRRLYLLFPDRLEAYPTGGFREDAAPQDPPLVQPLGVDCTGGYLRLGPNRLLVHCPGPGVAYAWTFDLASPIQADLTGLAPPLRLALFPKGGGELLAYLTGGALGYRPLADPSGQPSLERGFQALDLTPLDLRLDRARGRLLGLLGGASEGRLLALEGGALQERALALSPSGLALEGPFLVAYGRGFQALEPRDSGAQNPFRDFKAGLVGPDAYLYLLGPTGVLEVYDLVASPPQGVTAPALGLSDPKALALIPVE